MSSHLDFGGQPVSVLVYVCVCVSLQIIQAKLLITNISLTTQHHILIRPTYIIMLLFFKAIQCFKFSNK